MDRRGYFTRKLDFNEILLKEKTLPALEAIMANSNMVFKRDADTNGFFLSRELTLLEAQAIEYMPPDFTSRKLWQVKNSGAGIKNINYAEILRSGKAVFSTDGQTQVPNASATRSETSTPVRKAKIKYVITLEELEAMARSGASLDTQKALAAKEGIEALLNETVWTGYKKLGLKGYFTYAKDGTLNAITPATVGVGASSKWKDKTAEQIWDDLVSLATSTATETKGTISNNVFACSVTNMNILTYKTFASTTQTIMQRMVERGMFSRFEACPELESVTYAGLVTTLSVAIAYSDRPDCFSIQHPLEFTPLPLQIEAGFDHVVYCHADTAGLIQYRAKSGSYLLDV